MVYKIVYTTRIVNGVEIKPLDFSGQTLQVLDGKWFQCTCGGLYKNFSNHQRHLKSKIHITACAITPTGLGVVLTT
jgi:hypothetical protein